MRNDEKTTPLYIILVAICMLPILVMAIIYYNNITKKTDAPLPSPTPKVEQKAEVTKKVESKATLTPTFTPTPTATPTFTLTPSPTPTNTPTPTFTPTPTPTPSLKEMSREQSYYDTRKEAVETKLANGGYDELANTGKNWSFKRVKNHQKAGNWAPFDITEYDCFYLDEEADEKAEEKVIYLTLDCGYPSKKTVEMLNIFKEKDVKVTFFCTQMFLEKSADIVKRMIEEGHNVGNHTSTHQILTQISSEEVIAEITGFEERMYELTGMTPDPLFRCPGGNYSPRVLQMIKDLGYSTYQWSIAYGDYDKNNQPTVEYVVNHIKENYHNGAILLMHNDSPANLEAMPYVIDMLREEGFTFGNLYDFVTDEN